jgi:hypothetical protein
MKYKIKTITKKEYRLAPVTIRRILKKAGVNVGRYYTSRRVSGWGHFYGKVEVTEYQVNFYFLYRTDYNIVYKKIVCVKIDFWDDNNRAEELKVLEALKDFKVIKENKSLIIDVKD